MAVLISSFINMPSMNCIMSDDHLQIINTRKDALTIYNRPGIKMLIL